MAAVAAAAAAPASEEEKEIEKPDMNVKKPDEAEFNAALEAVQARLDAHQKRIAEIKETFDARENVRNASSSESGQARARLNELRSQAKALSNERNAIYTEISEQEDARKARNAAVTDLRKATPWASVEEIDRAIKEKELYQETHSLSLVQIKKLMAEIKEMQQAKPRVKELNDATEQLKRDKEAQNVLYARLKEKGTEVNGVRELERKAAEEYERIRKKEEGNRSDVPALLKERDEAKKGIVACREESRRLRDEHNAQKRAYLESQRLMKRWQLQERKKEWEAREAERAARRKEREAEEAKRVPWEEETALCDQLIVYLGRYTVALPKPADDAAPNGAAIAAGASAGVGRKGRIEEDYFVGGKVKAKKGKKAVDPTSVKVSHTPEVFASFDKLALAPPLLAGDCAAAVEALRAKKAWFKTAPPKAELRRQEEEAKKAAAAAEAAAAEAAKVAEAAAKRAEEEVREAEETERRATQEAADAAKAAAADGGKEKGGAAAAEKPASSQEGAKPAPVTEPEAAAKPASTSAGVTNGKGGCTLSISPISDKGVLVSISTQ